jgi:CubicO group peptidase (beta-lactamase class C family)
MTPSFSARFVLGLTVICLLAASAGAMAGEDRGPVIRVPFVGEAVVDGSVADWGGKGFGVNLLRASEGKARPDDGFSPRYRLGWNERGLVAFFEVKDLDVSEASEQSQAGNRDGVMVLGSRWDQPTAGAFRSNISPGINLPRPKPAVYPGDPKQERDKAVSATIQAAGAAIPGGYALEVLIPWSAFGVAPAEGQDIAFQAYAINVDGSGETTRLGWRPGFEGSDLLHLRLAKDASPTVLADIVSVVPEHNRRMLVSIRTAPDLIGRTVTVAERGRGLGSCTVERGEDGLGKATAAIPLSPDDRSYGMLEIYADGESVGLAMPPLEASAAKPKTLDAANLRFAPYLFSGTDFPRCDFEQPSLAEDLIGPHSINVTYYDKDYNVVEKAEKPGRYGAIVEVKPLRGGTPIRRFRTLFRQPADYDWWFGRLDVKVTLPKEMGIAPQVLEDESSDVAETMKWAFLGAAERDWHVPAALAGWYEMKPTGGKAPKWADALALDRQWWLGLKRKLYGADTAYPNPFVAPRPIEGKPATVLHEGALAEAGMKPGAAEKIDAVLQAWAAESDQGFAALVARHGVIVLHKAYGEREGKPMTTTTKSWMASITKTLSANLMMMLVDQGLVNLDDPADKYLPPLREVASIRPLTIRHLYTHTSGFPTMEHWGDDMSDMVEVVAGYYPYLRVGEVQAYNGVGLGLGGKIIEVISGETIPAFFHHHLLGPLGCANTDVMGTMGDSRSVPLDIAKIGQMMLNRGAYGDLRFYRDETFAKMLPQPMTQVLGRDDGSRCGIGLWPYDIPGLSKSTIGHGAASSATFLVDPVNDLVIVMTRETAGKDFGKHHPRFLQAIVDGIDTGAAAPTPAT